jgi:NAD(P)-dependent dehydrogenase (short-subunit alcohol dehydrogenase family)
MATIDLSDAHTRRTSLHGRKAIITGGTTGIGRAIAVLLASEGVEVFICGRSPDHLADALERIRQLGKGMASAPIWPIPSSWRPSSRRRARRWASPIWWWSMPRCPPALCPI